MIKKYTKSILYNNFVIYSISLISTLCVWYIHVTHRTIMQECNIACSFYNYEHINNFFERMKSPSHICLKIGGTLSDIRQWLARQPVCYINCIECKDNYSCLVTPYIELPKNIKIVAHEYPKILIKVSDA